MKSTVLKLSALMMFYSHLSFAQEKRIDDFTLTNNLTNKEVSLKDFKDKKIVVIIFTSNFCPYSQYYDQRIVNLYKEYKAKGVQFILVNPNSQERTLPDNGVVEFPYLTDQNQQLSSYLGATKTPEVFVFENTRGAFILKYTGAIDDNPQIEADVHQYFLKDALEATLNKNSLTYSSNRAMGCMIKGKK